MEDCNWETIFYEHYRFVLNQSTVTYLARKAIEFGEKNAK